MVNVGKPKRFLRRLFQAARGNHQEEVAEGHLCRFPQLRHFPQPFAPADLFGSRMRSLIFVMGKIRRKFETEFKRHLIGQIEAGQTTIGQAARDHQISRSVIEGWRIHYHNNALVDRPSSRERQLEAENEKLSQGGRARHADGPFKKIASLGSAAEKRGYIDNHREELGSISKACQVAGLPSSTFYYKPDKQHRKRRDDQDEKLRQLIERIHEELPGYGYRRIKRELKRRGHKVNEKPVRRVMKKFGLKPITWRTFVRTTDSRHALPVYPNLIKNRQVCAVNQVWVADITYIRIRSSFVYLAAILDLYSRKVVGWAISKRIDTELCVAALRMALETRRSHGCIHHSDRGVQYASAAYVALLRQYGLQVSMSAKGNPYDNAFMESFYKTLKYEEVHLWNYETYEDVIERLPFFLEEVYNRKRLHSSIGYLPPTEFEAAVSNMKPADRPVLNL